MMDRTEVEAALRKAWDDSSSRDEFIDRAVTALDAVRSLEGTERAVDLLREIGKMAGAKANGADARAIAAKARVRQLEGRQGERRPERPS